MHWFHFNSVRDIITCVTRQNKVCAPFCCRKKRKSSIKTAEIVSHSSSAKFDFKPRQSGQFLATDLGFETHKVCHSNKQNVLPRLPPNRFFYHPDMGGHVTSRNQGLSSNDKGKQGRETLRKRLANMYLMTSAT